MGIFINNEEFDDLKRRLKELEFRVGHPRSTQHVFEGWFDERIKETSHIDPSGIFERLENLEEITKKKKR
jgi:hypothetical protein